MIIAINAISAKSGGMKTYADNLIRSLEKYTQHTFHVWLPKNSNYSLKKNVVLHETTITYSNNIIRFLYEQIHLRKEIKKIKADMLFSTGNFGLFFIGIKQIIFIRNLLYFDKNYLTYIYPYNSLKKKIRFNIKKFHIHISALISDAILLSSEHMKRSLLNYYQTLENKCNMLYQGTKIDFFCYKGEKATNDKSINLLYVSKYYAHKNPGVIAIAVKILLMQNIEIHARITMDLDTEHARSMATWENDYAKLYDKTLKNNLVLGEAAYEDVPELYKHADIFIFPSISESYGHPMIEAMAAGLPIIAADTEINREICGDAAIYFSPFDGKELSEKIITLHNNKEQKLKMIDIGKNRIKLFKWEDHVSNLIKIFEDMYE